MIIINAGEKLSVFTFQPYIYIMEGYLPTKLTLHQKFNYSEFMAKCSLEKVNSDALECSSHYKKCHILYVLPRRQEDTKVICICVHTWDPQANRFGNRDMHPGYPICNAGQNLESRRQLLCCLQGPGKRDASQSTGAQGEENATSWRDGHLAQEKSIHGGEEKTEGR